MTVFLAAVDSEWAALASSLSGFGFTAWFAWYTQTKTIPTLQALHREERETARKDFLAAIDSARSCYLQAEENQRKSYMQRGEDDRRDLHELIVTMRQLAEATVAHVGEARAVWALRGELDKLHPKPEKPI